MSEFNKTLTPLYKEEHREALWALCDWLKERKEEYDYLYRINNTYENYKTYEFYYLLDAIIASGFREYQKEQEYLIGKEQERLNKNDS